MRSAPFVALALVAAACTQTGSAEPTRVPVPVETTVVAGTAETADGVALPENVQRLASVADVPPGAPQFAAVARADALFELLTISLDREALVSVPPLQPGQSPEMHAALAGFDIADSGEIFYGLADGDGESVWRVSPGGVPELLGPGRQPVLLASGEKVLVADGAQLTSYDVETGERLWSVNVGGEVQDLAVEPSGDRAAVVTVDATSSGTTRLEVVMIADREVFNVEPPASELKLPAWRGPGELSLIDRTIDGDHVVVVALGDAATVEVLDRIALEHRLVSADWDGSGTWMIYATAQGELGWLGDGVGGVIDDDEFAGATW